MNPQTAIVRLLQQLFKRTARQSRSFERYQIEFLNKLHISPSEKKTVELFNECLQQLKDDVYPLEETLSEGRLSVSQSQLQLQKLNDLSESSIKNIAQINAIEAPYTIIEYHNELTSLIKIYQRIVNELSKNKNPLEDNNQAQLANCKEACEELQKLIKDLDIAEPYVKPLEDIRQQLANCDTPFKLPEYCISIITIVIDSTRDERRSSRRFLYSLNDSLTQFYLNFSQSIKHAENHFDGQEKCFKTIQRDSIKLKHSAEQAMDIESLRENIFDYVKSVEKLFSIKEQEKEQKVHEQMQGMIREIKELQNETQSYQKTLKRQNEQLHLDFLTKVPNRAAWSERLQIEYDRCKRYKNSLNIAVIDIDNFKKINDSFGHLAGDKVLTVIAQTMSKSLRNVDFIARYGGEEFAVLLPEVNVQQMNVALEKLRHKIKNIPFKFKKDKISITISIGCTTFVPGDSIDCAFERADKALYHAKHNGRNKTVYFAKE